MTISEIKKDTRQKLTSKWGRAAFIAFGFVLVQFIISLCMGMPLIGLLIAIFSLIIQIPLNYGLEKSFFNLYHGEEVSIFDFLASAINNFAIAWSVAWRKFLALIVPYIITAVSGALCLGFIFMIVFIEFISIFSNSSSELNMNLLIPAIAFGGIYMISSILTMILGLKYSIARLISIDEPNLNGKECILKSKELMKGNVLKYFLLNLSFIGWAILIPFTLGIGSFWLVPYIQISIVAFYRSIRPADEKVAYKVDEIVNGTIL